MTSNTTLSYSITYAVVANLTILILALLQDWQFSELFFFLFMQSILVGIVALATIFLVSLRLRNIASAFGHAMFFILHYFTFIAVLIFGVIYESGYLSLTTLNQGLTDFFTAGLSNADITPKDLNLSPVLLVLGVFIIIQTVSYYKRYKSFEDSKKLWLRYTSNHMQNICLFSFLFLLASQFLCRQLQDMSQAGAKTRRSIKLYF